MSGLLWLTASDDDHKTRDDDRRASKRRSPSGGGGDYKQQPNLQRRCRAPSTVAVARRPLQTTRWAAGREVAPVVVAAVGARAPLVVVASSLHTPQTFDPTRPAAVDLSPGRRRRRRRGGGNTRVLDHESLQLASTRHKATAGSIGRATTLVIDRRRHTRSSSSSVVVREARCSPKLVGSSRSARPAAGQQ